MTSSEVLGERMSTLVRVFGLLDEGRTPCGQPLSVSAAHALLDLAADPLLSQGELAERLRLEKSTVSRLVDSLTRRGWVRRDLDAVDGRIVRLALTELGLRVVERLAAARTQRFCAIFERIPRAERARVIQVLGILIDAIDDRPAAHYRDIAS